MMSARLLSKSAPSNAVDLSGYLALYNWEPPSPTVSKVPVYADIHPSNVVDGISTVNPKWGTQCYGGYAPNGSFITYFQKEGNIYNLETTGEYTVDLWWRFEAASGAYNPIIIGNNTSVVNLTFSFASDYLRWSVGSQIKTISPMPFLATGQWHHLALCSHTAGSRLNCYINGVYQGVLVTNLDTYVKNRLFLTGGSYSYVDEVRVRDTAIWPDYSNIAVPTEPVL